nr:trichohyalin-like [Penaeus vannamei]
MVTKKWMEHLGHPRVTLTASTGNLATINSRSPLSSHASPHTLLHLIKYLEKSQISSEDCKWVRRSLEEERRLVKEERRRQEKLQEQEQKRQEEERRRQERLQEQEQRRQEEQRRRQEQQQEEEQRRQERIRAPLQSILVTLGDSLCQDPFGA